MPNPKQPKKKIEKSERHWCSKDCDDCGDSLRKQEEKEQYTITSGNVCPKCKELYKPKVSDTCEACSLGSTPKVATSEKEDCAHNKILKNLGTGSKGQYPCNTCKEFPPTPHESEDWEAEFNKLVWNDTKEDVQMVKDFIKQVESKTYQRGREDGKEVTSDDGTAEILERYNCYNYQLEIALLRHLEKVILMHRSSVLSLAVQEIEKEKKDIDKLEANKDLRIMHPYAIADSYFNQGLDKAKSIISGLMKK